ncbi:YicC/YloC family endoribonuclease [Salisediminibacterium halotolerans]|uniref:TIGR00255 family protein n=1 Tax=Salisediminibacterium halotolerans TaxID=517425 RepID=A0A1H9PXC3_9BACI|nr:YicC/YloC family endoribonuclease [Salisediminibacterium haloalkalitolerans]SER52800.1 TIGR00255 family protein [Salisediminibacterium haloalkalitolerans]
MLKSMTGFGRSVKEIDRGQVTVEMRAVNHRFSEVNMRLPRQLFFIEDRLKKTIAAKIQRGKVDAYVNIAGQDLGGRELQVDWELFNRYYETFERMAEKTVAAEAFPIDRLLLHDEVVTVKETEDISAELVTAVEEVTAEAAEHLAEMREHEGAELCADIKRRLDTFAGLMSRMHSLSPDVQAAYHDRLQRRMEELLAEFGETDEQRLMTEVAVHAEKTDFQEELTRMDSHVKQFRDILQSTEPVGRKLDFLMQEMNREVNTIGSKAGHLEVNQLVVEMKAELEKIREQIQNVE